MLIALLALSTPARASRPDADATVPADATGIRPGRVPRVLRARSNRTRSGPLAAALLFHSNTSIPSLIWTMIYHALGIYRRM